MKFFKTLIISIALLVVATTIAYSEQIEPSDKNKWHSVNMVVPMRLENAAFYIYNPPFKAKAIYKSIKEAKCLTPEELMNSIKSAITQEWVDYNYMAGHSHKVSKKAFENRRKRDKDKNYFELVHKLKFMHNGVPAIIKYWFVEDEKRTVLASLTAQKVDGRWHRTGIVGLDYLSAIVKRIKPENMLVLLSGKGAKSVFMKELVQKTRGEYGRILDAAKLYKEMAKLRADKNWDKFFTLGDKGGM